MLSHPRHYRRRLDGNVDPSGESRNPAAARGGRAAASGSGNARSSHDKLHREVAEVLTVEGVVRRAQLPPATYHEQRRPPLGSELEWKRRA